MTYQISLAATPFVKALMDAGLIPDNCRHCIIDCVVGEPIRIYYEVLADERINEPAVLNVIFAAGLEVKTES
jgi:hypothetical protein